MKTGDRVICIDDSNCGWGEYTFMKKGNEYTIVDVFTCDVWGDTVVLVEGSSVRWMIMRFRKITRHTFTNELTKELAKDPIKETIEEKEFA